MTALEIAVQMNHLQFEYNFVIDTILKRNHKCNVLS